MKKTHRYALTFVLALLAVAGVYGLPVEAEAHSELAPDPMGKVPASLDEQIYTSAVVVLASLLSVGPDAEFATGLRPSDYFDVGDDRYYEYYRPMQVLRFQVHEYLKGTGPSEIVVEVRHFDNVNFTSLSEALAFAAQTVADRNSTWDDRPGILFLNRLSEAESYFPTRLTYVPTHLSRLPHIRDSKSFGFTLSNTEFQDDYLYTIDSLSRAWLPSLPSQDDGEQQFLTNVEEDPPPDISLSDLRTRIAEIDALVQAGDGIEGYENCLYAKLTHDRELRALDGPWEPWVWREGIGSGLPAGSEIYRHENRFSSWYDRLWVTGPLAELFEHKVVDDDSDPYNGHSEVRAATRPLPLGIYHANFHWQHGIHDTCDFNPDNHYFIAEVVVDPPSGVLHEAFFDPTEQGTDDLSPAEFTVGGTPTSIEGLRWTGSSVELALDPSVSLAGSTLDLIALDGSVSLSLPADEATADGAAGALSWPMPTPPWQTGDRLMLRIWSVPLAASPPAAPAHEKISAGWSSTCALRDDGEAVCWGYDWDGETNPPEGDRFVSIAIGGYHSCGLREDGVAVCWGSNVHGRSSSPPGEGFVYISVGGHHTCGLRTEGGVMCWGRNDNGQTNTPADEHLVAVSGGLAHTCGLRADGTAVCWGEDRNGQSNPPEGETFVAISASWNHTCGLRGDGDVVCWGEDWDGRTLPPPGEEFVAVSAGGNHTCGLRAGGDVLCWGEDREGQSSPPAGERFVALSAGERHTCGLREDGDIVCWGSKDSPQSNPPRDWRFESIASGADHTCGLLSDGAALCWGSGYTSWSVPLEEGVFDSISAGGYHTCGLQAMAYRYVGATMITVS